MEHLIKSVRKLSLESLRGMRDPKQSDNDENGDKSKLSSLEEENEEDLVRWRESFLESIRFWGKVEFGHLAVTEEAVRSLLLREFGPSVSRISSMFLNKGLYELCPHLELTVTEKSLSQEWERLTFKLMLEDETERMRECGSRETMPGRVPVQSENDKFSLQIWKRKLHVRSQTMIGIAKIPIPLPSSSSEIKLTVLSESGYEQGWLKVKMKLTHRGKEPASKVLPKLIASHLKSIYHSRLESTSSSSTAAEQIPLEDSDDPETLSLEAIITQKDTAKNSSTLLHSGKSIDIKYNSETVIDVNDLFNDSLELRVITPEEAATPSKSKRRSSTLLWTPTKNKDKRRKSSEALLETLLLLQEADDDEPLQETDGAYLLRRVSEERLTLSLSSVPWNNLGLKVLHRGSVEWTIKLRLKGGKEFDAEFHYKRLFKAVLGRVKERKDKMDWDGSLDEEMRAVSGSLRLLAGSHPEEVSIRELLGLRSDFEFSNEVAFQALGRLMKINKHKEENNFDKDPRLKLLGQKCLLTFLGVGFKKLGPDHTSRKTQVHYAINILNMLFNTSEADFVKTMQETCLEQLSSFFHLSGAAFILEYLREHVALTLGLLDKKGQASRKNLWSLILCNVAFHTCLDKVSSFDSTSGHEKTFLIYVFLLKNVAGHVTKDRERLFKVFQQYLEPWADHAIQKASEQVGRVISLERDKHGESVGYWRKWAERGSTKRSDYKRKKKGDDDYDVEWLEASINVNGIFFTCHETWREIRWEDPAASLRFATRLFQGMHSVFKKYVQDFLDIILGDDIFNKYEFVILLENVLQSMTYLRTTLTLVSEFVEGLEEEAMATTELKETAERFSEVFSEATLEADDTAENIVLEFVRSQRKSFSAYADQGKILNRESTDEDSEEDDEYLLSYVNGLLKFLHEHLDSEDQDSQKFHRMLDAHILKLVSEVLKDQYDSLKEKKKKKGSNPEAFRQIAGALPELIEFRRNLSLAPSDLLNAIQTDLYPRSSPTSELISEHICACRSRGDSQGEVSFRAGFLESSDKLIVQIKSVSNLKPREGDEFCNFSLTLAVLPLSKEPYLLTQRTQPYKKANELDFELDTRDETSGRFVFHLPSWGYDMQECHLQIDLYHQLPVTYNKRFSGKVTLPLHSINLIMKEEDLKYIPVLEKKLSKFEHVKTPEFDELVSRKKDLLARAFVERYDKQRKEGLRFEARSWATVNESQYSSELISRHFYEMINNANDKGSEATEEATHISGELELQIAWHETREEVILKIWTLSRVRHRMEEDYVNPSVVIRVEPTKSRSKSSKIYPCSREVDLHDQQDGEFSFRLGKVNYNYHAAFVRILLFDNVRSKIPGKKSRRFFLGHVLYPLSDLHPIDERGKFKTVAARTAHLLHLRVDESSSIWTELNSRKDSVSTKYVEEVNDFRDRNPVKHPYVKSDWMDPIPEPTDTLISRHLNLLRSGLYGSSEQILGTLKYSIGIVDAGNGTPRRLSVKLKSIYEVRPMSGDQTFNCNFSLELNVMPLANAQPMGVKTTPSMRAPPPAPPASASALRGRTLVYAKRTSLLFDLLTDIDGDNASDSHRTSFDFPLGGASLSFDQFLVLDLFLHKTTSKCHRGSVIVALDTVEVVKKAEDVKEEMESVFRYPADSFPSSKEYLELDDRSESQARKYLDFVEKRTNQGSKPLQTLFTYHEWAKI